jgi:hypothetical protein
MKFLDYDERTESYTLRISIKEKLLIEKALSLYMNTTTDIKEYRKLYELFLKQN